MEAIQFLKKLSDHDLINKLKNLVGKERSVLTDILHHLKEVEVRKLHLALGYSSLFAYLTEGLSYSESAAYRRIQAMRLIKAVPEAEQSLENGDLSLSVASQLQTFIQNEEKRRKTQDQVPISPEEKQSLITQLQGVSARQCEQKLAELSPEAGLPKEKTRPLTDDKFLIQFTAGRDLMGKIQKLKSLWSHQNPEGSLEQLFEKLVDMALEKADPEKKIEKKKPRLPTSNVETSSTRYIPQFLKREILKRDQGKCQYRNPRTGKLCLSDHMVEIDHRWPVSLGGENTASNLRLLCRSHNKYRQDLLEGG